MRMAEMCLDFIDHPSAWRAADMADESTWTITLDDHHVDELDSALAGVRDRPYDDIRRDDFPLPTFSKVLEDTADILENGRGFVVLQGIPIERHEQDDVRRLFFGLSTYVGRAAPQTTSGEMMLDVMVYPDNTSDRGFTHSKGLPFHSDQADILALLCLAAPASGGLNSVASAVSVHNHILTHHRELLGLLYKEYCYDKGEAGGDDLRYFRSQIFGYFEGRLACRYYSRMRLEAAPALTGIPVSPVEFAALDLFEATAADPEFRHDFMLRPGSLLLLSNTYGLHSRTPFEDGPGQHRHLLRLALNPYQQRAFPEGFAPWREGLL